MKSVKPFALSDGRFGIVYVAEITDGQSFAFADVEDHIKT